MAHGRAAVGVVHRLLRADRPVRLELTPLCTWRSVHGERFAFGAPRVEPTADGFVFEDAFRVAGAGWEPGGDWYRGVRAREEAARGLNDGEDVWAAGTFAVDLAPGETHEVTAAAAPFDGAARRPTSIVAAARSRAAALVRPPAPPTRSTRSSCSPPTSSRSRRPAGRRRSPATRGSASGRAT